MSLPVLPPIVEAGAPRDFNKNYILFWNNVALDLNRLTHTTSGPQDGPPVSARALGILHLAIHDAYFGVFPYADHHGTKCLPNFAQYLTIKPTTIIHLNEARAEAKNAVAGAAIAVLSKLYKSPSKPNQNTSTRTMLALGAFIDSTVRSYANANNLDFRSSGYVFGVDVAKQILLKLEIKSTEAGVDPATYMPNANHPYFFDDDPSHPVRPRPIDPNNPDRGNKATRPYHGPVYGISAAIFATTTDFKTADPYVYPQRTLTKIPNSTDLEYKKYLESVEDVHRMGGAEGLPSTKRSPAQTAGALFWAYDGVNLIGTPPRLYNQIIRQVAYDKATGPIDSDMNNAEFARLLALANVAMADAGIFCWREKYHYDLWRPLSGVRQDPTGPAPGGFGRPTWKVLGAPTTNSNEGGFKPPFPAYPSGHATFGAAAFQIVRRFYHARDGGVISSPASAPESNESGEQKSVQVPDSEAVKAIPPETEPHSKRQKDFHGNDMLGFCFVSDELNGINRELYQPYDPSHPITDQAGDVRTRMVISFNSMKEAIFTNAISRIWLGVHWHFDAFAGEDVMEQFNEAAGDGKDTNLPRPKGYEQLYQCEADGSTKYVDVKDMDWFHTKGPREGDKENWWFGGVPLGMLIADDIFTTGMKFIGSLENLSVEDPMTRC